MSATTTRIPAFNASDPEQWFQIVEASFNRLDITTAEQKYCEVIAVIPPHYAKEVRDVIMAPVTGDSYSSLKTELITRLCASQEEKTRQLLENEAMGDEKPSQFLRRLLNLAGNAVPEAVVRSLWMRRLPSNLQPIIATQKDKTLVVAADLANVIQASTTRETTNTTTSPQTDLHLAHVLHQLTLKLDQMAESLVNVKKKVAEVRASRSRASPDHVACVHRVYVGTT